MKPERSASRRLAAKIVFGFIAVALFSWTAYLTVTFLSMALPGAFWIAPYLGLVVFDVGTIGWMIVNLFLAEGAAQRTISAGLTLFNLLGIGLISMAEIVLGGQTLTAAPAGLGTAAIWGIGIWTFVNVAGIVAYHMTSPAARLAAAIQDEKDATVEQALDNMRERRAAKALLLSEQMGGGLYSALLGEVLTDGDRDGIPDLYERKTNVGPRTVPSDRPRLTADQPLTEVDIIEFLAAHPELLALARPVDGVGRNTYTSDQPPAATPGQGERPNGPPAPTIGRRSPDGAPDF